MSRVIVVVVVVVDTFEFEVDDELDLEEHTCWIGIRISLVVLE